jgi:hypothetical protein
MSYLELFDLVYAFLLQGLKLYNLVFLEAVPPQGIEIVDLSNQIVYPSHWVTTCTLFNVSRCRR